MNNTINLNKGPLPDAYAKTNPKTKTKSIKTPIEKPRLQQLGHLVMLWRTVVVVEGMGRTEYGGDREIERACERERKRERECVQRLKNFQKLIKEDQCYINPRLGSGSVRI